MKRVLSALATACVLCAGCFHTATMQSQEHVIQSLDEAKWGTAPPLLPAGAQIAVLAGDPTRAEPYTIRLKFPANYAIPSHSHPTDEHVVVISGALTFGMGDKLMKSPAGNKTLGAGGFALMPANMNHYAYTGEKETTIVLYGQGPVEFKYVNAADDPRIGQAGTH